MNSAPHKNVCPNSVWGVVGNIVGERPFGPGGEEARNGTRLFRPDAKAYLASLRHAFALNNEEDAHYWSVQVVCQHRKSRRWIQSWVRLSHLSNWRIHVIYKPGAVQRLWEADWDGFNLAEAEFSYDADRDTQVAVSALLDAIHSKHYRKDLRARDAAEVKPWWRLW